MASAGRAARRRVEREAKAPAKPAATPTPQQRSAAQAADPLANYIGGYQAGYTEGYFQAVDDLLSTDVVKAVSDDILAVHHDPLEQARYVLRKARKAMTPTDMNVAAAGIQKATTAHLQKKGLLPTFPGDQQEATPEEAEAQAKADTAARAGKLGLVVPGA